MARKGENIYKRKDGRWEARYPSIKPNTRKIFFDEIKNGKNFNAIVRKLYPKQSAKQIVKMLLIKAKIMGV